MFPKKKKTVCIFKTIYSDYSIECWIMQKAYFTVKNVESVNISMFNCILKCFWKRKIIWLFKKLKRLFSDTYFLLLKTCFVNKVFYAVVLILNCSQKSFILLPWIWSLLLYWKKVLQFNKNTIFSNFRLVKLLKRLS